MSNYLVFVVTCVSLLLSAISVTSVSVAFPAMIAGFDTSLIAAGWTLSIYQLAVTAAMPLAGKASDAFGRKRVFIFCLSLFTVGSLLSALSPSIGILIAARLIQGIGGGGFMPSVMGLVADAFPNSRQKSIGLTSSIMPIGQIIGPNLGAWLTATFGWRSVFWFNVPLGVIVLIACVILLKSSSHGKSSFDLLGAGLFAGSLSAFMAGISMMGNEATALNWLMAGALVAGSIILMVWFIRQQARVTDPVIDLHLLKEKRFFAANVYNFFFGVAIVGVFTLIPLFAVTVYGMSTLESGLILTTRSVAVTLAAVITSLYLVRWGYRWPIIIGTMASAASLVFLALEPTTLNILGTGFSITVVISLILLLSGIGGGIIAPAANNACIELMPHRVATITGIRGMFRQAGAAISITISTLILHLVGNLAVGFFVIFLGLAIILLSTVPLILMMPDGARMLSRATVSRAG
jgi:EmrB/QacA subfamily drug resistance transporter